MEDREKIASKYKKTNPKKTHTHRDIPIQKFYMTRFQKKCMVEDLISNNIHQTNKYANIGLFIVQATLLTGIRTDEWFNSEITINSTACLEITVVSSSKIRGGNHNKYRHLSFSNPTKETREIISKPILFAKTSKNESDWAKIIRNINNYFLGIQNTKPSVTLLTLRRQFIFDIQASGYTIAEISAITGESPQKITPHNHRYVHNFTICRKFPAPNINEVENINSIILKKSINNVKNHYLTDTNKQLTLKL